MMGKMSELPDINGIMDRVKHPMHYNDKVNHPAHYNTGKIECIDYIEDKLSPEEFRGYIKGNVIKYLTRERHKNGDEDIRKAKWYLDRLCGSL